MSNDQINLSQTLMLVLTRLGMNTKGAFKQMVELSRDLVIKTRIRVLEHDVAA